MRALPLLALLAFGCASRTPPQPVAQAVETTAPVGTYLGTLDTPAGPMVLAFHLNGDSSTLDSVTQGVTDLPAKAAMDADGRLVVLVPAVAGRFDGAPQPDGSIQGTWSQGAAAMPLVLAPHTEAIARPRRPQEPVGPFPYSTREVAIPSGTAVLAGTVVRPETPGPHPVVVFLTGSGPQDRNETLMGHKPFFVLADHLARHGIASLRFDDRGVAGSSGDFGASTMVDFATDAVSALRFVRTLDNIGPAGWLGHSEGGVVAPMAARTEAPDFFISLAGPSVPLSDLMLVQLADMMTGQGLTPEVQKPVLDSSRAIYDLVKAEGTDAEIRALVEETGGNADASVLNQRTAMFTAPWMQHFLRHDPTADLEALKVPTLALYGSTDVQVSAAVNDPAMRAAMADNPALEVVTFQGLNHLFQHSESGMPGEYGTIEETLAPEVLERITTWLLQLQ